MATSSVAASLFNDSHEVNQQSAAHGLSRSELANSSAALYATTTRTRTGASTPTSRPG